MGVVTGYAHEVLEEYLNGQYKTFYQEERLGTGHAVMQALPFLNEHINGDTLILCGDAPFIEENTIKESYQLHKDKNNSVTLISAVLPDPSGYGRIIRENGSVKGIVEHRDCSPEQLCIKEIN